MKDYSNLYSNPSVHGFLPQINEKFVEPNMYKQGITLNICPSGLIKHFKYLKTIFKPFLLKKKIQLKPMFLLSGAKGSGKKTTLEALALSLGLHLIHANCFDFSGQNLTFISGKFDQIFSKVRRTVPCILHLQNIEVIHDFKIFILKQNNMYYIYV